MYSFFVDEIDTRTDYFVTSINKAFLSSRSFVIQDWQGGQDLEVEQVPDGLSHQVKNSDTNRTEIAVYSNDFVLGKASSHVQEVLVLALKLKSQLSRPLSVIE